MFISIYIEYIDNLQQHYSKRPLLMRQDWFMPGDSSVQNLRQAITWANDDPVYWHRMHD